VLVEPGTPAGYRRILTARQQLIDAGLGIVAPCPHSGPCPLVGADWCHFAARVNRSSLHRRIKGGTLGHEDEKFSYVAAVRGPSVPEFSGRGRVLRHPQRRKGLVGLRLCRPDGTAGDVVVSKRHREEYRAAKDIEWGEEW
jgi:ribosomal protein RSM22 (predicted rRNA methylase)